MPCYWVREERGVAYRGWKGPVHDRWICLHHAHIRYMPRTYNSLLTLMQSGVVQPDDLVDGCGEHDWYWAKGW